MKILVDTCIWVDFLASREPLLRQLLFDGEVLIHPFIIGEIACGSLKNRREVISLMQSHPHANLCDDSEVLHFLEKNRLFAKGIGWVDLHLLASCVISKRQFWTRDKRLLAIAKELLIALDL